MAAFNGEAEHLQVRLIKSTLFLICCWTAGASVAAGALVAGGASVPGGAWVAEDASVARGASVARDASVARGASVPGGAWVAGDASVARGASVPGGAWVAGDASVARGASVAGGASVTAGSSSKVWAATTWTDAHATFYGGTDASGTMGGSCGYGNTYSLGYGIATTALSNALFNHGLTCGACFQIECKAAETTWCYAGKSITVTATNLCPQGSFGGWCDMPKRHFDLAYPMFTELAQAVGGVIPVQYRRMSCQKQGGIRFTVNGNPWFLLTLVFNVGGGGDVNFVAVKGSSTNWFTAVQSWGANWAASGHEDLVGQSLCYRVTLGKGNSEVFDSVAPSNWGFGQTYFAQSNFY